MAHTRSARKRNGRITAGAAEALYLAFAGALGGGRTFWGFIIPAVLGNIIGGVLLVALINHGQIVADRHAGAQQD